MGGWFQSRERILDTSFFHGPIRHFPFPHVLRTPIFCEVLCRTPQGGCPRIPGADRTGCLPRKAGRSASKSGNCMARESHLPTRSTAWHSATESAFPPSREPGRDVQTESWFQVAETHSGTGQPVDLLVVVPQERAETG